MEIEKVDSKRLKGLAVLFMVCLHLFCRKTNLPYSVFWYIGDVPAIYYLALFCDSCVAIFCFCSGYAQYTLWKKEGQTYYRKTAGRLFRLLVNFWIILAGTALVGLVLGNERVPGSVWLFIKHILLLDYSYNGSWWFLLTYILLIVFYGALKGWLEKKPLLSLAGAFAFYFLAYLLRFNKVNLPAAIPFAAQLQGRIGTFGTSLLPFLFGVYFAQVRVMSRIAAWLDTKAGFGKQKLLFAVTIFAMIVAHGIEESQFVAPFTGLVTIVVFHLWSKRSGAECIKKFFGFLGEHSTNIWLVHMFLYNGLFTDIVFRAKFVLPVLVVTMLSAVAISAAVQILQRGIMGIGKRLMEG